MLSRIPHLLASFDFLGDGVKMGINLLRFLLLDLDLGVVDDDLSLDDMSWRIRLDRIQMVGYIFRKTDVLNLHQTFFAFLGRLGSRLRSRRWARIWGRTRIGGDRK